MSDSPKAYAITAADGAQVHLDDSSDDEKFDVKVQKDGANVETHAGLTAETIGAVSSEHFTVEYIDAPTPDSE